MSEEPHILLGAYILGGLDADERRLFEAHIEECARCRKEAAEFAPLPALLSRADPDDLGPLPAAGSDDVLAFQKELARRRAVGRRRRRSVVAGGVLAGAAAIVAATTIVMSDGGHQPPGTGTFAMRPAAADVSGAVTLTPKPWGTAISLELQRLPSAGVFTLRTMDDQGRMQPAASWAATPNGAGAVEGSTSIPMPRLRKLNVVDADNRILATMER